MTTSTPPPQYAKRPLIIVAVVIALLATALAVAGIQGWLPGQDRAADKYTGSAVPQDRLEKLDNNWSIPHYLDLPADRFEALEREDVQPFVNQAIQRVDNLRAWHLCADELRAEAKVRRNHAVANKQFPRDMPYDLDADEQQARTKWAEALANDATFYDKAAVVAQKASLPCIAGAKPIERTRWLAFQIELKGKARPVAVSDSMIMLHVSSLEDLTLDGRCANELRVTRDQIAATPVQTTESKETESFSEQMKANEIVRYDARIELTAAHGLANC